MQTTKPTRAWALALAETALSEYPILGEKICLACDIKKEEVMPLLVEAYLFLGLIGYSNQKLRPSLLVDYAWHELILCTRHYHHVCEKEFGRYIHHHPGGEEKENKQQFVNTWKLYQQVIGSPPEEFWGIAPFFESSSADCGSCSSM